MTNSGRYILNDADQFGCDSIINLSIFNFDTLPAPVISCQIDSNIIYFSWAKELDNDGYLIEIQGVVVDTITNQTFYEYPLSQNDSLIHFRVIPFGNASCPYEIGEVTCDLRTSSTATTFHESGIKIHPNPTNGQVQIESESAIKNVTIFDISGRKILETKHSIISLTQYSSGVYFFRIETKLGISIRKVIRI